MRHKTYKRSRVDNTQYSYDLFNDLFIQAKLMNKFQWRYAEFMSLITTVVIRDKPMSDYVEGPDSSREDIFTISEDSHLFNYDILIALLNYTATRRRSGIPGMPNPEEAVINALTIIDLTKAKL